METVTTVEKERKRKNERSELLRLSPLLFLDDDGDEDS